MIMHGQGVAHRHLYRGKVHLQVFAIVGEDQGTGGMCHRIHRELVQVEADEVLAGHAGREDHLGAGGDALATVVGHINADIVMLDVEGVAPGDGLLDALQLSVRQWPGLGASPRGKSGTPGA